MIFQNLDSDIPPCWRDICPGASTPEQVIEILGDLPADQYADVADHSTLKIKPHTYWKFLTGRGNYSGDADCVYRDGHVAYCSFRMSGLRLRHVIEKYGEPEAVAFSVRWADSRMLTYLVLYPERGLIAVNADSNWRQGEVIALKSNMPIGGVYIFAPKLYEALLSDPYWMVGVSYTDVMATQRSWSGYGVVEFTAE